MEEGRRSGIEGNDPRGRRHLGALEQPRRGVVAVAADHQSRPTTKAPSVSGYVNITSKVSRLGFGHPVLCGCAFPSSLKNVLAGFGKSSILRLRYCRKGELAQPWNRTFAELCTQHHLEALFLSPQAIILTLSITPIIKQTRDINGSW